MSREVRTYLQTVDGEIVDRSTQRAVTTDCGRSDAIQRRTFIGYLGRFAIFLGGVVGGIVGFKPTPASAVSCITPRTILNPAFDCVISCFGPCGPQGTSCCECCRLVDAPIIACCECSGKGCPNHRIAVVCGVSEPYYCCVAC